VKTPKAKLALALAATVLLASAGTGQGQSNACLQLTNQLAQIDSGGGFRNSSPRYLQYDQAVRDQEAQIAKTERAARFNGCFGIFNLNRTVCDRISTSLDQMKANLVQLRRTRDSLAGERVASADRGAIIREMDQLGCVRVNRSETSVARAEPRRRSLLEQIFGVRTYSEDGFRERNEFDPDSAFTSKYGTYRTLCVRKCDGYYFPISFSTSRQLFSRDSAICQSMCPDTDVELYVHGMPNQESEDMVSWLTGEPYASLPAAFSYRKKLDPQCTCRFRSQFLTEIAGTGEISGAVSAGAGDEEPSRIPQRRIDPGIDPETLANAEGNLTTEEVVTLGVVQQKAPPPVADLSKKIRVVGPEFFPVQ
jgi:hypothetical protein